MNDLPDPPRLATERRARERAESLAEKMAFLSAASAVLGSSLDYQETLRNVAWLAVPTFADWCAVDIVMPDGSLERLAVAHPDARLVEQAKVLQRKYPMDPDADYGIAKALRTGEAELVREISPELIDQVARDDEHRRLILELGLRSYIAAPMRARDRTLGAISFVTAQSGRRYAEEDLVVARELASRGALAIDHAELYKREQEARRAAEAASQAKTEFLAMMSHELRTPLSAIIGYQELLYEEIAGPVSPKQKEHLARIRASAMHLRDLINQILSLSRIEAGKELVQQEEVDIASLATDAVLMMEQEARSKGLELRRSVPDRAIVMRTDAAKVRQILLNLLSNAIKFTASGHVSFALEDHPRHVVMRVKDTGVGISPEDQVRIFEPFTQVERSITRRRPGTGLGLPLSQKLARMLGGRIELSSKPGEGSTFTVRLPRDGV